MGFLDNLENSLKSLEAQDERGPGEQQRRQEERAQAVAVGPWAERLKNSAYTQRLFDQAALAGHRLRTKIYMAWFDSTLRLEAKQRRLELRPTAEGIVAAFIEVDGETEMEPVDLNADPGPLLSRWLSKEPGQEKERSSTVVPQDAD